MTAMMGRPQDAAMQLCELRHNASEYIKKEYPNAEESYFYAKQNASVIHHAEEYYRSIIHDNPDSWNIRNKHMFETLEELKLYLARKLGRTPHIVVWAHNAHIGNARATEMHKRGEFNIGQLIKDKYKDESLLIGITCSRGTVLAADNWNEPGQIKEMNMPIPGSYEDLFYRVKNHGFLLDLRDNNTAIARLMAPRLQRSIGVIYKPETERYSHYFEACLPEQFDFVLERLHDNHFQTQSAVCPE
jgi:erythromycin esterase-like protein